MNNISIKLLTSDFHLLKPDTRVVGKLLEYLIKNNIDMA